MRMEAANEHLQKLFAQETYYEARPACASISAASLRLHGHIVGAVEKQQRDQQQRRDTNDLLC